MLISDIQRFCMHDGPGIRTTVFFKGCPLQCAWCHNPETQSFQKELLFYKDKCIGCGSCNDCREETCMICGKCAENCPAKAREIVGTSYSPLELLEEIQKDAAFYEETGGVTFSGGECMAQIAPLEEILKLCKEKGIHTAVDTCGYAPYEHFERILPYTDLFLYDIKLPDSEKHKHYTGVGNELILDNLKKLLQTGAKVWIRIPVIPTVNDSVEEMQKIKDFLSACEAVDKIELLPYHPMGESKAKAMEKQQQVFGVPGKEKMDVLRGVFV